MNRLQCCEDCGNHCGEETEGCDEARREEKELEEERDKQKGSGNGMTVKLDGLLSSGINASTQSNGR